MFPTKAKIALALLLAAGLLTGASGALLRGAPAAGELDPPPATKPPPAAKEGAKHETTVAGRVLDPDGKPVAGARVYLTRPDEKSLGVPKAHAVSGDAGQFRFSVPAADQEGRGGTADGFVFATADGFGLAWVTRPDKADDLTLRLAKDDVPVTGRVVNLEGRPVAGVTLKVNAIKAPPGGSLAPWLEAVKARRTGDGISIEYEHLLIFTAERLDQLFPAITTGADGRFTLRGIGRERAVALLVEGPTIETKEINVLTRPGLPTITVPRYRTAPELGDLTYYSAGFDHAAAPCRPVSGVVRDKATGKPVAGATVRAERGVGNPFRDVQTTTDHAGRYRLNGLPGGRASRGLDTIVALPPEGQAYLSPRKKIDGGGGIEPATLDFEPTRGVWIEGRVTDKVTGEGVEARVRYFLFPEGTPEADAELRGLYLPPWVPTDGQGRFRFVGVPTRALLGARASSPTTERFRIGVGADKIEGGDLGFPGVKGARGMTFRTLPHYTHAWDHDALAEVKPAKGVEKVTCDLVLDPGRTQRVRVLGPDGKPLGGARVAGQFAREYFKHQPLEGAEFTVYGLTAGEPRTLLFFHEGKKVSGLLQLKGTESGTVEVKLQPSAAVTGRLVDGEGRPMSRVDVNVYYQLEGGPNRLHNHPPGHLVTDAEGRFSVGGMIPGLRYLAHVRLMGKMYPGGVFQDLTLKAGESKDLGDVRPRTRDE